MVVFLISAVVLTLPSSFLLLDVNGFLLFPLSHRIAYSSYSGYRKRMANSFITSTSQ